MCLLWKARSLVSSLTRFKHLSSSRNEFRFLTMCNNENQTKEVKSFTSHFVNAEGKKIFCKYWEPPHNTVAHMFIAHGYGEHCLCYDTFANHLASRGFLVFSHDHEGHGQSEGERVQTSNFGNYVQDVFHHLNFFNVEVSSQSSQSTRQINSLPLFLFGHSMGGTICILAALKKPELIHGLILCSPAVTIHSQLATPCKKILAYTIGRFLPNFPLGSFEPEDACSSPESRRIMEEDILRWHGSSKAKFCALLLDAIQEIQENVGKFETSFLILQGEEDKICDPDGAKYFYENTLSNDKCLIFYSRAFHNLLMEPPDISQKVIDDIFKWLLPRA